MEASLHISCKNRKMSYRAHFDQGPGGETGLHGRRKTLTQNCITETNTAMSQISNSRQLYAKLARLRLVGVILDEERLLIRRLRAGLILSHRGFRVGFCTCKELVLCCFEV